MTKQPKNKKSLPHVTPDGITPAQAGLAGLTAETPAETQPETAETPEPETVADEAMKQAQTPPAEIVPNNPHAVLWLPGGEFLPGHVSSRVKDALADCGRMRTVIQTDAIRVTGSPSKGATLWNGTTLRPAKNDRETAAVRLAKAAAAFAVALRDYGAQCK